MDGTSAAARRGKSGVTGLQSGTPPRPDRGKYERGRRDWAADRHMARSMAVRGVWVSVGDAPLTVALRVLFAASTQWSEDGDGLVLWKTSLSETLSSAAWSGRLARLWPRVKQNTQNSKTLIEIQLLKGQLTWTFDLLQIIHYNL